MISPYECGVKIQAALLTWTCWLGTFKEQHVSMSFFGKDTKPLGIFGLFFLICSFGFNNSGWADWFWSLLQFLLDLAASVPLWYAMFSEFPDRVVYGVLDFALSFSSFGISICSCWLSFNQIPPTQSHHVGFGGHPLFAATQSTCSLKEDIFTALFKHFAFQGFLAILGLLMILWRIYRAYCEEKTELGQSIPYTCAHAHADGRDLFLVATVHISPRAPKETKRRESRAKRGLLCHDPWNHVFFFGTFSFLHFHHTYVSCAVGVLSEVYLSRD